MRNNLISGFWMFTFELRCKCKTCSVHVLPYTFFSTIFVNLILRKFSWHILISNWAKNWVFLQGIKFWELTIKCPNFFFFTKIMLINNCNKTNTLSRLGSCILQKGSFTVMKTVLVLLMHESLSVSESMITCLLWEFF